MSFKKGNQILIPGRLSSWVDLILVKVNASFLSVVKLKLHCLKTEFVFKRLNWSRVTQSDFSSFGAISRCYSQIGVVNSEFPCCWVMPKSYGCKLEWSNAYKRHKRGLQICYLYGFNQHQVIWPHSGHYRSTEDNWFEFLAFMGKNDFNIVDVEKGTQCWWYAP